MIMYQGVYIVHYFPQFYLPFLNLQLNLSLGGTSIACDFTYDLCGWSQDKTDNFDWLRNSGGTATQGTGPTADHTNGSMLTS